MKRIVAVMALGIFCLCGMAHGASENVAEAAVAAASSGVRIGVVNFKTVVEAAKYGKQEQASFESLKKQMESVLEEKDKALNEMAAKLDDQDYLDGLSSEAENELKHKFRTGSQELSQIQNQYYQALTQANTKVLQKLSDMVVHASQDVAKAKNLDMVLSEESGFFFAPKLDISKEIIEALDRIFEQEQKSETEKQ